MILDVYKDAFEYSAQDWTALVKLGVINVLGMFIFLPLFLISGYNYRVIKIGVKGMINGEDELPEFDEWVNMFVDGIKVFIVEFAYALIPIVLFFAVFFVLVQYVIAAVSEIDISGISERISDLF